jgi:intein/homing endonuclease
MKLAKIAEYLDSNKELIDICNADIYWDKVISIKSIGKHKTYDISMKDDHNFVANNFITHNSTIMLNLGINIYKNGYDVLFVPLEMPREKMYEKFLSNLSEVPFERIEHPTLLDDEELAKINNITESLQKPSESHFYIMETYERIPVSIIRREIEKHVDVFKPRVVIVDYIANLTGEANREKERDDLLIGNMLKDLRTMGRAGAIHKDGFAIITAAQIGREALRRIRRSSANKVSFHSEDIRGSHEYSADADNIYAQMVDEAQPNERLMIFPLKCRYGKKTFANNSNRAVLEIKPEVSLIKSIEDEWIGHNRENIMKKVDDKSVDVGDEELAFAEEQDINNNNKDFGYNEDSNIVFDQGSDKDDDFLSVDDVVNIL